MIRVFLDANILFSCAWREGSGIHRLWERSDLQLVTSPYALKEAESNLATKRPEALERLSRLASKVELSSAVGVIGEGHGLPDKDLPILAAAAGADCKYLLTGDITHFGHLIGVETHGVRILTVSLFLARLD
jgi:predicted nucleic acid-binding protein